MTVLGWRRMRVLEWRRSSRMGMMRVLGWRIIRF